LHYVDLDYYYSQAIQQFPGAHFAVFTNDIAYAKSKRWLQDVPHTFIEENEIDSLLLMSKCAGGICANSSFSWWGAYLTPNRKITLPEEWILTPAFRTEGLYFPDAIVCPTKPPFDAYCIHLPHRTDRQTHMEKLAAKYPCLRIHFVEALSHSNGAVGGNLSHKKAIREAKERGDPFVLVLEDDCQFLVSNKDLRLYLETIQEYIKLYPDVEIVNGCGNLTTFSISSSEPFKQMHFLRSNPVYTAHCIVYCAPSYDKLLASSTEVAADVVTNGCHMVFTYPYLATQIPSYSDIQLADVSYQNIEASRAFIQNILEGSRTSQVVHKNLNPMSVFRIPIRAYRM
jgi:hypothetical protein